MWLLYTLPMGANRSKEELRARTLVGAVESLRCGITTVQDMLGLVPLDDAEHRRRRRRPIATPASASCSRRWSGIFRRSPWSATKIVCRPTCRRCWEPQAGRCVTNSTISSISSNSHPAAGTLHWAVAPFAPQRCTPKMLCGCADLAHKHDLAVYTHVYETRGQVLIAREQFADHGGSFISYLEHNGLLNPRLNIVHSVWIHAAGNGSHGRRRRGHRPQPSKQHEAQERDCAGLRSARGRRAARDLAATIAAAATCRVCFRR